MSRVAVTCIAALSLSACGTVVDPQLSPDKDLTKAYSRQQSLPAAVALGESMRAQYASKVEDQILLDRVVGLALIGAAASVVGLATTGAATVPIIATTLGGGALFGTDSLLSNKPQQFIYAAGANAVQCALDSMQPMIVAYGSHDRLQHLIDGTPDGTIKAQGDKALPVKIAYAETLMASFGAYTDSPTYLRAQAAVQQARAILDPARQALNTMNISGGILRSSLASIELQVTNAIISSSPSIPALAQSLGFALPAIGRPLSLPPVPSVTAQAGGRQGLGTFSNENERELAKAAEDLEQTTAEITTIISAVNERPSADKLKTCNVDVTRAGLTMTIDPVGEISIPAPSGSTPNTATIRVSGGVLPYSAGWSGATPPPAEVTMGIESGQGIVTVTVEKGARPNVYAILIRDAANGAASTGIRITDAVPAASGASGNRITGNRITGNRITGNRAAGNNPAASTLAGSNSAEPTCAADETTRKVQSFLLQNSIKTVQVGASERALTEDGCYGDITAAIQLFLRKKGLRDDEIPKGQRDLTQSMVALLPASEGNP